MWVHRQIRHISRKEKKTNKAGIEKAGMKQKLLKEMKARQLKYFPCYSSLVSCPGCSLAIPFLEELVLFKRIVFHLNKNINTSNQKTIEINGSTFDLTKKTLTKPVKI
jgi:hypothetical protein